MDVNPLNNQKPKEKKQLEKAVQGNVNVKKPSLMSRFFGEFINKDIGNIWEYLLFEVVGPTLKDMFVDGSERLIELLAYGKVRGKSKSNGGSTYVQYSSMSTSKPEPQRGRRINDLDTIEFENRGDAEHVVDIMNELIDMYGEADVGDLYDLMGVTGNGFVDRTFGWRTKIPYNISYFRGMWVLKLPRCIQLS